MGRRPAQRVLASGHLGRGVLNDRDSRKQLDAAGAGVMTTGRTVGEPLPLRPAEAHALDVARNLPGSRIVCTTVGRGQAARTLAHERPDAAVACWFLDLFQHDLATESWAALPRGLQGVCVADMPAGPFDLAVVPLAKDGEAELSRDILQSALVNLAIGGHLVTAIDNPRDNWLREQLAETGEKVRVRPAEVSGPKAKPGTVAYVVEKTREPAKVRDFSCEIVFRDRDRLLTAFTRPGVFAHRRIDPAARHLLGAVDIAADARVLDIGCGSGSVALGIASRDESVRVHAIDSSARAVECTRRGAAANGLSNLTVALEAAGRVPDPGTYDLVLANPPYYSDFRIAERFVEAARAALAAGGTLLIVTKQPSWYVENLPASWRDVARAEVNTNHLIEAVRP
ncbi:MAG: class I SAM-dependent methyltransferase [Planctomycetia bacterium]